MKKFFRRIRNIPYWVSRRLPLNHVLDRREGWIATRRVSREIVAHQYKTSPWLVVQGKSPDWGMEFSEVASGPFFKHYVPQAGDHVVSVGAGIGTEAFLAARHVGPDGAILAIEGDPMAFAQLTAGIQLNQYTNVLPFLGLATDKNEWTPFQLGDLQGSDFTTSSMLGTSQDSLRIFGFTLDSILKLTGFEEPDLLLMNIEGAELKALSGITLLPKRIVVSCHDFLMVPEAATYREVIHWMESRGYRIVKFTDHPTKPWEKYYLFGERNNDS